MFQFARSSAKAALVAVGAAGFVAFGAGVAGADVTGAMSATDSLPVTDSPAVVGLPAGLGGTVTHLAENADLATALPAPGTENVATPLGDMSHVGPQVQRHLDTTQGHVDRVGRLVGTGGATLPQTAPLPGESELPTAQTLPAADVVPDSRGPLPLPQATELLPAVHGVTGTVHSTANQLLHEGGTLPLSHEVHRTAELPGLPVNGVNGTVHSTANRLLPAGGTLPMSNEVPGTREVPVAVDGTPAEIAGAATGLAVERTVGTLLPRTTEQTRELAAQLPELPEPSTAAVTDALPEVPVTLDAQGGDLGALEEAGVPGAAEVNQGVETVNQQAPSVEEVAQQVDTEQAVADVVESAGTGAGATGVVDAAQGVGLPTI
ncbi:hypothetical protein ACFPZ0_16125 [Streptomonospora nanhaiensis]|uniref:Secreted protein n=1 Tax=Streptomonospora nanhaiensis TaxID=1323731 RepID=A0A853BPM4_9ACTN|nr:hypothetical protein [Streptomonospora nanhaiensis]MBV2363402.1 hypothetical protein [Streptomonospora nanhaiensis]MBX9389663.1 hypothetical protein [Streptomonospora nanhaiensis]NYI96940.1 hypothetical protein [Streptomonospora nanhaiensis]